MKIKCVSRLSGTVRLPGDKSISHRAAMLAALADGTSEITNFASSADCGSTLDCLSRMGIEMDRTDGRVTIRGKGMFGLSTPLRELDCGNSGTTMRLISGILSGQSFSSTLLGDASLSRRPMKRIMEPLSLMGAEFGSKDGHAPLQITGRRPLTPISYELPVASAQIKSAILLAGLFADGTTEVIEPVPTRDHTERMLRGSGAQISVEVDDRNARLIRISGLSVLSPSRFSVPSDISSAAFFLAAAAGLEGSSLEMPGVGINPTRSGILDILRAVGANIRISDVEERSGEPTATLSVSGGISSSGSDNVIRGAVIPNIIDEIPILAVLGTQLPGGLEIRDAAELRHKESDRIAAVCGNLRRMGAEVEEFPDGLRVGRSELKGAEVDSFGDHRIAMAFAIAGLFARGETDIVDAECAAVSFPEFFDVLNSVSIQK